MPAVPLRSVQRVPGPEYNDAHSEVLCQLVGKIIARQGGGIAAKGSDFLSKTAGHGLAAQGDGFGQCGAECACALTGWAWPPPRGERPSHQRDY
jgi:hypothetical protein